MNERARVLRRYRSALGAYLRHNRPADLEVICGMGSLIVSEGVPLLELAKFHEQIIIDAILPKMPVGMRVAKIKQAAVFFSSALIPLKPSIRGSTQRIVQMNTATIAMLSQRSIELALENTGLKHDVVDRKAVEAALIDSERKNIRLLEKSNVQQAQMRRLSHDVLVAQENERKEISRELHDVIAQTLAGINIRLTALKRDAELNAKGFEHKIAYAQRLVSKAVDSVQRFARKLRPEALDDLGLIPALHSCLRNMREQTGIHIKMNACADVESLDIIKRTVLFRVAQEALVNISRHAHADNVRVGISAIPDGFCMEIQDDGRSFDPQKIMLSPRKGHLGIIGMRERMEMVGGSFEVVSGQGKGTLVSVKIYSGNNAATLKTKAIRGGRQ